MGGHARSVIGALSARVGDELQIQVAYLRRVEASPADYHLAVSGFLAKTECNSHVREYFSLLHPSEPNASHLKHRDEVGRGPAKPTTAGNGWHVFSSSE